MVQSAHANWCEMEMKPSKTTEKRTYSTSLPLFFCFFQQHQKMLLWRQEDHRKSCNILQLIREHVWVKNPPDVVAGLFSSCWIRHCVRIKYTFTHTRYTTYEKVKWEFCNIIVQLIGIRWCLPTFSLSAICIRILIHWTSNRFFLIIIFITQNLFKQVLVDSDPFLY